MAQAKALLEETCADHFTEEVPSAIRTALSSLAEADGMLVESKKMVDSVVKQLSLYQATQRKRKSAAIANDKDWRGNRDLEFQKTLPRSVRKRVHERMAEIAGNSSETERRNAYEKSVRYTVSWKTGRKPCSMSKHDAGVASASNFDFWHMAKRKARDTLSIKGACTFKKGTAEYEKAREFLKAMKGSKFVAWRGSAQ